jgi:hypothetical protein
LVRLAEKSGEVAQLLQDVEAIARELLSDAGASGRALEQALDL